jgi:hypothetical protein
VSARPQESLYYARAQRPSSAHPAPNNAGVVLVVMMLLAIVTAVAFVGPGVVGEVRQITYCMNHAQEAVC